MFTEAVPASDTHIESEFLMTTFRVMTWNIQSGRSLSDVPVLDQQAAFIAAQAPDIVMLQEVASATTVSLGVEQIDVLSELSGMICLTAHRRGSKSGMAPRSRTEASMQPHGDGPPDMEALTEQQAFQAMSEFLWQYARRAGDDLITLLGDIELEADGRPTDPAAWGDWLDCVRHVRAGLPPRREAT